MDIKVKGRTLSDRPLALGVQGDNNVEELRFLIPRYTGSGVDLSQGIGYAVFRLPDGTDGYVSLTPEVMDTDENMVALTLLVGSQMTEQKGSGKLCLKVAGLEAALWSSAICDIFVGGTIELPSPQPYSLFRTMSVGPRISNEDSEPPLTVTERTINIPTELQTIAVAQDENSEAVQIVVPRYFDGQDLSVHDFILHTQMGTNGTDDILFNNQNGQMKSVSGSTVTLTWVLRPPQTSYEGKLSIQLLVQGDEFKWHSLIGELTIAKHISGDPVVPTTPSMYEQWLAEVKAQATLAKGYSDTAATERKAAEAARDEAEEAANRAQSVVDNAQAYSKQETHDRFALALQGTADPAASITIYPDAGSNVAATAHGFTIQEGSGDPTPPAVTADDFEFAYVSGSASSFAVSYIITTDGKLQVGGLSSAGGSTGFSVTRKTADNGAVEKEYDDKTLYFIPFSTSGTLLSASVAELQAESSDNNGWDGATTAELTVYVADADLGQIIKATAMTKDNTAVVLDPGFDIAYVAVYFAGTTEKGTGFNMYLQILVQALAISGGNVREIANGGLKLFKLIVDGTQPIFKNIGSSGSVWYDVTVECPEPKYGKAQAGYAYQYCNRAEIKNPDGLTSGNYAWVYAKNTCRFRFYDMPWLTSVEDMKAEFARHPAIIWFVPETDFSKTRLYAPFSARGLGVSAVCPDLTAPLCEGDTIITKIESGCDVEITFDGSEDENWVQYTTTSSEKYRYGISIPSLNIVPGVNDKVSKILSNKYSPVTANQTAYAVTGISVDTSPKIVVYDAEHNKTLEDFRASLATYPLTVRLCSTEYSKEKDKKVSLERHVRMRRELGPDDKFSGRSDLGQNVYTVYGFMPFKARAAICSQYKSYNGAWQSMPNNQFQMVDDAFGVKDDRFSTSESFNANIAYQHATGKPVTIVYELSAPLLYAHDPVDFIANPGEDGAWVITGEANGKVSAVFNKNITHTIAELQAALVALGAQLSL